MFGKKSEKNDKANTAASGSSNLTKLSKKELLEIMLRQGEEIDSLRAQLSELQAKLDDKEIRIGRAGSLAEASLAVTGIFEEAQKAASIYLQNAKRMVDESVQASAAGGSRGSGAGSDE